MKVTKSLSLGYREARACLVLGTSVSHEATTGAPPQFFSENPFPKLADMVPVIYLIVENTLV